MFTWMPVIFTFMLGSFPAGLVIYWTWNNTLTILQQSLIMKRAGVKIELFDNLRKMFGLKSGPAAPAPSKAPPRRPRREPRFSHHKDHEGTRRAPSSPSRLVATRLRAASAMPEADWIEAGRKLFAGPAISSSPPPSDGLPPVGAPEIAFAGRSNVGKSSLINALTGRTALARTSNTPGRTQELIFFDLGDKATLVDMPGYGYAAVGKEKSASWGGLVRDYLRGRPSLLRAFVLVDGRHGLKDSDDETMKLLDASAVSYAIVLTKRDEVKQADQPVRAEETLEALRKHAAAYPQVFFTSAHSGEGVPDCAPISRGCSRSGMGRAVCSAGRWRRSVSSAALLSLSGFPTAPPDPPHFCSFPRQLLPLRRGGAAIANQLVCCLRRSHGAELALWR